VLNCPGKSWIKSTTGGVVFEKNKVCVYTIVEEDKYRHIFRGNSIKFKFTKLLLRPLHQ